MIKHDGRRSFHLREEFKKMRSEQREGRVKAFIDKPEFDEEISHEDIPLRRKVNRESLRLAQDMDQSKDELADTYFDIIENCYEASALEDSPLPEDAQVGLSRERARADSYINAVRTREGMEELKDLADLNLKVPSESGD